METRTLTSVEELEGCVRSLVRKVRPYITFQVRTTAPRQEPRIKNQIMTKEYTHSNLLLAMGGV